jgi:hypothetical protein
LLLRNTANLVHAKTSELVQGHFASADSLASL